MLTYEKKKYDFSNAFLKGEWNISPDIEYREEINGFHLQFEREHYELIARGTISLDNFLFRKEGSSLEIEPIKSE